MSEIINFYSVHYMICNIWLILLILSVFFTMKSSWFTKIKMISGPELTFLMTKKDAKVIDIRTQQEYMQGHIFNSINILANDINQGYWKELEKYKLNTIIIVGSDLTNIEENKLALKIKRLGFPHIYILEDGIRGWNKLNLPLVMGK